jgi:hypothetical protein
MLKMQFLCCGGGRNAGSREFYTETELLEPSTGLMWYVSLELSACLLQYLCSIKQKAKVFGKSCTIKMGFISYGNLVL